MDILTLAMAKAEVDNLKKSGGVGYTENSSTVVIEKAEREFAPIEDMGGAYGVIEAVKQLPSEYLFDGDYKAAVHFDGIDHRCELVPSGPNAFFGNMMLMGGEDTGEPFVIMVNTANNIAMMFAIDTAEKHTVGISFVKEAVHTIEQKYLPGAVLPVVELKTVATTEGVALTDDESARLDECCASGVPVIVKANIDLHGYTIGFVASMTVLYYLGDASGMAADVGHYKISLDKSTGSWVFGYQVM